MSIEISTNFDGSNCCGKLGQVETQAKDQLLESWVEKLKWKGLLGYHGAFEDIAEKAQHKDVTAGYLRSAVSAGSAIPVERAIAIARAANLTVESLFDPRIHHSAMETHYHKPPSIAGLATEVGAVIKDLQSARDRLVALLVPKKKTTTPAAAARRPSTGSKPHTDPPDVLEIKHSLEQLAPVAKSPSLAAEREAQKLDRPKPRRAAKGSPPPRKKAQK